MQTMRLIGLFACLCWLVPCGACRAGTDDDLETVKTSDNYKIMMGSTTAKDGGSGGKLLIEIRPVKGWKFNKKAPVVIKMQASGGIELDKTKLRKKDAAELAEKKCRFEVAYKSPKKPGSKLELKFDFVICTDTLCQKKRFTLSYPIPNG